MVGFSALKERESQNFARKQLQERCYHYYNGNQYQVLLYLEKILAITFNNEDIVEFQKNWINITKKIVNQLAVIYRDPASRSILINGDESKTVTKYYNDLIPQNINTKDKAAHRYAKLFNTSITGVFLNRQTAKIEYRILPSYLYDIEVDDEDFYKLTKISYKKEYLENGNLNIYRIVWTDKEHYRQQDLSLNISGGGEIKTYGDPKPVGNNTGMVNPWGVIPYIPCRMEEQGEDFWGQPLSDLVNMNEIINFLLCELVNEQIVMGGVGTLLGVNLKGKEKQVDSNLGFAKLQAGRKHPILVENIDKEMHPPSLTYTATNPIITEVRDTIDWKIKMIAMSKGLNPNSFLAEVKATSGYSKLIDSLEQIELRKDDLEPCRNYERDRFVVTRAINNYFAGTKEFSDKLTMIDETAELQTDFAEVQIPLTTEEQIKQDEFDVDNNLTNYIDIARRQNPDLTDKELEKQIMANKVINDRINPKPTIQSNKVNTILEADINQPTV